ncbi:MAG: hypothetical protein ACFE8B_05745 [Candidatus Hermodarchaeota archaeon]
MFYTIADDLIFYQLIRFIRKYSNSELKLYQYFYSKTNGIYPEFVIIIGKYIFFFVNNKYYFNTKKYLDSMRREVRSKKILIVRVENVFIRLLFSLFPDLYIHDIALEFDNSSGQKKITIFFLTFKERRIAIGRGAEYIRTVNKLFNKYIIFENEYTPIEIECKSIIN